MTTITRHENTYSLVIKGGIVSFPNLIVPVKNTMDINNVKEEFVVDILFPQDTDISAYEEIVKDLVIDKWGDKVPHSLRYPLKDGNARRRQDGTPYEEYQGMYYFVARCSADRKPIVVNRAGEDLVRRDAIVGGDIVNAMVNFFAYDRQVNKGISLSPHTVMLVEKAENPFGGGASRGTAINALTDDMDDMI